MLSSGTDLLLIGRNYFGSLDPGRAYTDSSSSLSEAERLKFFVAAGGVSCASEVEPRQKTGLNSIPRRAVGVPWIFNGGFLFGVGRCAEKHRRWRG